MQYTREEFLRLSAQEVNTTENAGLVLTRIQQTLQQGHLLFESAQRRKDGTLVPVEVNAQALEHDGRTVVLATYRDLTERKQAAAELERIHQQLLESSRLAGMAEVATGVLHNVGNVLNSINVSTTCLAASSRKSKVSMVRQLAGLLKEHAADLGSFLTRDDRGRQLPSFLQKLAERLDGEQAEALKELANLDKNVGHIKEVIAMQQSYANVSGVTSNVKVGEVIEDAVRINLAALTRHGVQLVRQWAESLPEIIAERHKILQILVNLLSNAKYACAQSQRPEKRVTLRAAQDNGRIQISVTDNGVGISPENLTRIFAHGFTTRKSGHGFGLHSSALAAKEMGGALYVQSDGPGQGASFTLELPLQLARGG